jgi:5-(carboxyamino)imidazole ribonucleotide synthase
MEKTLRIGIIGGGQLGMMLLEAAKSQYPQAHFTILEQQEDCPARPFADAFIQGKLTDDEALRALASVSDVLTWEIEHIGVDTLIDLAASGVNIIPRPNVLKIIQDKGLQKQYYASKGIPTAPFLLKSADEPWELDVFPGDKVVIKSRTGGYDGKGVVICSKESLLNDFNPFEGGVLVEAFVPDVKEIAVIVAVAQDGSRASFPTIDMYFNPESNLVEFLYSPSLEPDSILIKAKEIAEKLVASFDSPGLFAVEMFVTESGEVWVNEVAPRPHNSGHHSIEGFETSQFEQLNRILVGDTLGSNELKHACAMINIVGPDGFSGAYQLADTHYWKSQGDVFIHMYGKTETRPNRKLGHVTVIAQDIENLLARAKEVQERLHVIPS